jgi:hypothetical protein
MRGKTPPRDPCGRHIRVYVSLLNSPAWRALGWSARALFVDLRASVNATNNGAIAATLADLRHRGWRSSSTLAGALYELQAAGLLIKTRGGGVEHGSKTCSLYAFADLDVLAHPKHGVEAARASHAYARFESLAQAEREIAAAIATLRNAAVARKQGGPKTPLPCRSNPPTEKKSTLRNLEPVASISEAMDDIDGSETGAEGTLTLRNLEQESGGPNRATARAR